MSGHDGAAARATTAEGGSTVQKAIRASVGGRAAWRSAAVVVLLLAALASGAAAAGPRSFASPDEAVLVLLETVKAGDLAALVAIFGPEGQALVDTSDPATGQRNREVFLVAMAEGWRLSDVAPDRKELVLGNEDWPFPVPLVKGEAGWSFDATAGREEILDRRIGRNELAVIRVLRTYVGAQRAYARTGHDGKPAGLFARQFASDAGKENGLYWPAVHGKRRSPLGVLIAEAAEEGYRRGRQGPSPFHGYFFRILEGQGKAARGGAMEYVVDGDMSRGFALVAWPVHYDASGVMTFVVNQDGIVYEKDLGPKTDEEVKAMGRYDPDSTWGPAQPDSAVAP